MSVNVLAPRAKPGKTGTECHKSSNGGDRQVATKIVGIEGKTFEQLDREIADGGAFVYYQYAISIIVMTFRRGSDIYYIPPGESRIGKGLPFSLMTFVLGWWGIPWGPIYSIGSLWTNFNGGENVTEPVMADLAYQIQSSPVPAQRIDHAETGFVVPEER